MLLAIAGCASHDVATEAALQDAKVGDAALTAGNPDVALRLADDALTRNPNDTGALTRRGAALTALGRLGEARDSLRKAVRNQPGDVQAQLAFGRVELPVDPAAAATAFQAVLRQNGNDPVALNDLGIAQDLQGQHAEAEASYRGAIAAAPDMTAARVNLALCLAIRGRGSEAIGLLRPLADRPDAARKVREDYAAVLAMAGERDEARRILASDMDAREIAPALDVLASARTTAGNVTR
ncbi:MAG TPA: tetratricopeptide repeat protein [Rhodopila sp.]